MIGFGCQLCRCGRTTRIIRNNVQNKVITRHRTNAGAVPCTLPIRLVSFRCVGGQHWQPWQEFRRFPNLCFVCGCGAFGGFFPQRRPKANNVAYFAAEADVRSDADADGDNHWHAPHTRPPTHTHPLTYCTSKLSLSLCTSPVGPFARWVRDSRGSESGSSEQARNKFGTVSHVIGSVSFIVYRFNSQATRWAVSSGLWRFVAACLGSAFVLYSFFFFFCS